MITPSPNGLNGRDAATGRFTKGNPGGPGNPHSKRVATLRTAMLEAVTDSDIEAIVRKLVELATDGDVQAAREVLSRCLGKPEAIDLVERLERLEVLLGARVGTEA